MTIKDLDVELLPRLKRSDVRAKRRVLSRILEGSWTALVKGRGMEFAGFRKYAYGDDASMIDWNATLRAKETLVREFEEFKTVNVFFLIDVSDSMLFSSTGKLKAEYGAEMIFSVAAAVQENGDAVGYGMFNDELITHVPPSIGKDALYRMAAGLSRPKNYGGKFDLKNVVKGLMTVLPHRALIIMVSDFIGVESGWEQYIKMIAQSHDLIGIMLRDPRDRKLPELPTQALVEDPFTGERLYIDAKQYGEQFEAEVHREEEYIKNVFEKAKAGFFIMQTDDDMLTPVMTYFKKRTAMIKA